MDGERLEELFDAYLAGDLTDEQRAKLTAGLERDEDVQRAFAEHVQWSSMIARGVSLPAEEPPETIEYAEAASARHPRIVRRRRPRAIASIAIATAALAAAAGIVIALAPSGAPPRPAPAGLTFTTVFGEVRVDALAGTPRGGSPIAEGALIVTPPDGRAGVRFADGTEIEIDPGTSVRIARVAPKAVRLDRGSIEAEVAPQPQDAPMVVETADARVEVVGTKFTAVAEEDGSGVEVESGAVRFVRVADSVVVTVEAGRSCVVAEGADFKPIRLKVRALMSVARAKRTYGQTTQTVRLTNDNGSAVEPKRPVEPGPGVDPGVLTDGLLARFAFDERAGDRFTSSVASGPLAHISGRIVAADAGGPYYAWVPGKIGGALRFSPRRGATSEEDRGAGGVVNVPRKDNVIFLRGDHSIAAWVRFDDEQHTDAVTTIMMQPGWVNGLTRFGDRFVMAIFDATRKLPAAGWNSPVSRRQWHHAVGVMDTRAAKLHLYIDGALRESTPYVAPAPRQGESLWLIGSKKGGISPTECTVDELRVYNRVLDAADVRALYRWTPGPSD